MATKLVSAFYHSVELVENKSGGWQPKAPVQGEWDYVGPDDGKKLFGYIRSLGTVDRNEVLRNGSCGKGYSWKVPYRIVFFCDYEKRNTDDLINALISFIFISHVNFSKILLNKRQLLSQEAPDGRFTFREQSFYFAVDFDILVNVSINDCATEIKCVSDVNPICK